MAGRTPVDFTVRVAQEVPQPHSSRRGRYMQVVTATLTDGRTRELECSSRQDAQAVYAGVLRALDRIVRDEAGNPGLAALARKRTIAVTTRTRKDGTVSVFMETQQEDNDGE